MTYIDGIAKNGTVGQPIFCLPPGFRCRNISYADQMYAVNSNNALGLVGIGGSDGRVVLSAGSNVFVYLSGISFPAEL